MRESECSSSVLFSQFSDTPIVKPLILSNRKHTDCGSDMTNGKRMDIWTATRTVLEESPGLKASELLARVKHRTGLGRSTVYSHLESFDVQGKIEREKGKYWLEGQKTLSTKSYAKKTSVKHSKDILLGLHAILSSDQLWFPQEAAWAIEVQFGGGIFRKFAEEHLESGYPEIYEKLKEYRNLSSKDVIGTRRKTFAELKNEICRLDYRIGAKLAKLLGECELCVK